MRRDTLTEEVIAKVPREELAAASSVLVMRECADKFGVSVWMIKRLRKMYGITDVPPGKGNKRPKRVLPKGVTMEDLRRARASMSAKEVGKLYGVAERTIRVWLQEDRHALRRLREDEWEARMLGI